VPPTTLKKYVTGKRTTEKDGMRNEGAQALALRERQQRLRRVRAHALRLRLARMEGRPPDGANSYRFTQQERAVQHAGRMSLVGRTDSNASDKCELTAVLRYPIEKLFRDR
jgi:hypothetical protein